MKMLLNQSIPFNVKIGHKRNEKYLKEVLTSVCKISDIDIDSGDWLLSQSIKGLKVAFKALPHSKMSEK